MVQFTLATYYFVFFFSHKTQPKAKIENNTERILLKGGFEFPLIIKYLNVASKKIRKSLVLNLVLQWEVVRLTNQSAVNYPEKL